MCWRPKIQGDGFQNVRNSIRNVYQWLPVITGSYVYSIGHGRWITLSQTLPIIYRAIEFYFEIWNTLHELTKIIEVYNNINIFLIREDFWTGYILIVQIMYLKLIMAMDK